MKRCQAFITVALVFGAAPSACVNKTEPAPRVGATAKKEQKRCFGIVNGEKTTAWSEVVLLAEVDGSGNVRQTCTGTFVSDTTLLTAAHCVQDTPSGDVVYIAGDGIDLNQQQAAALRVSQAVRSVKLITDSRDIAASDSPTSSASETARDLAVLLFPPGTGRTWLTDRKSPWSYIEPVMLVGFGLTFIPDGAVPGDGVIDRRLGRNKIYEPPAEYKNLFPGTITVVGPANQRSGAQNESLSSSGDSGGPLLAGGQIIGVLSSGVLARGTDFTAYTRGADATADYVDLNSAASQSLLRRAEQEGATFASAADTGHSSDAQPQRGEDDEDDDDRRGDDDDCD